MALHLEASGNHRALVTLVETWAEHAVPTVAARIAEARALLALRMLDRAWVRLKDLVESPEPNIDALGLAAEMFLLRGWPNQAKRVIQRGLERAPQNAVLVALHERSQEPPSALEDASGDGDAAPTAELVRVAEYHMSRGAFVRARTLLERVRRRSPDHERAMDLLWGIGGDLTTTESLRSLCDHWSPDVTIELPEEPEHTESARLDDLRPVEHDPSFPRLFRNLQQPEGVAAATELTDVSSMAEVGELISTFSDKTDHGEDTQIARVMHKGRVEEAVHIGTTNVDSGFNLADFRREMGMSSPELDSDYHAGPEDEDDSVVIHTGRGEDDGTQEISDAKGRLARDAAHEQFAASRARRGPGDDAWVATPSRAPTVEIITDPGKAPPPKPTSDPNDRPSGPSDRNSGPVRKATPPGAAPARATPPGGAAQKPTPAPVMVEQSNSDSDDPGPGEITQPGRPKLPAPRVRQHGVPQRPAMAWPNPVPSQRVSWPYWVAAISAVLAFFVLVFAVISVVFAIT